MRLRSPTLRSKVDPLFDPPSWINFRFSILCVSFYRNIVIRFALCVLRSWTIEASVPLGDTEMHTTKNILVCILPAYSSLLRHTNRTHKSGWLMRVMLLMGDRSGSALRCRSSHLKNCAAAALCCVYYVTCLWWLQYVRTVTHRINGGHGGCSLLHGGRYSMERIVCRVNSVREKIRNNRNPRSWKQRPWIKELNHVHVAVNSEHPFRSAVNLFSLQNGGTLWYLTLRRFLSLFYSMVAVSRTYMNVRTCRPAWWQLRHYTADLSVFAILPAIIFISVAVFILRYTLVVMSSF